ncbi:MAG: CopG family antitoxin [Methylobacter sp.]|nr:CopG family antitoxin [Methylobacter sp.]
MSKYKPDHEEQALLKAFDSGEFEPGLTEERSALLAKSAEESFKKDKRINIRISSRDLEALQRRALEEGLPYQSLVSSVLHKYVSGGFKDVSANKAQRPINR